MYNRRLKTFHVSSSSSSLWPLFMDRVQLPQGYSLFKEAIYFLPFSSQKFLVLILVCTWFVWFTSLGALFIWTSGIVMSIVLITHAVNFSTQEVSRRQVAHGRINVCETMGRKNNCKLNFFSMYFVQNNEEIHLSFKNSEK